LIEIDEMAAICADPELHSVARCLLQWVAKTVSAELNLKSQTVILTVIDANYQGAYPCLAARHESEVVPDWLGDQIESAVRETLAKTSLSRFLVSFAETL
jgi:hypothetical protein